MTFLLVSLYFSYFFIERVYAQTSVEGFLRARTALSQAQSRKNSSFLTQGQFYLKGIYYPSNILKSRVHFLFAKPYDSKISFKESIKIYPSFDWLISDDLELKIGRILYETPFSHVVSSNAYEDFLYAFDGAFLEYNTDILNINFWAASLSMGRPKIKPIHNFPYGFGFFLDIKSVSDYIDYLNIHVAYLIESKEVKKTSRYGLGLKGTINPLDISYLLIVVGHTNNFQFRSDKTMYHIRLNYSYPDFLDSIFSIGYHTDSTDYQAWLYDRHNNAGFLDLFLWGNLTYFFFDLKVSPTDLFDIRFSFYNLKSTGKGVIHKGYFGSLIDSSPGPFSVKDSHYLGQELDLHIETSLSDNFEIHFLTGLFIPDSRFKTYFQKETVYNNVQLTSLYKF